MGDDVPYDQSTDSTDDRWFLYKARTPEDRQLSWGDWLQAGQPVPED